MKNNSNVSLLVETVLAEYKARTAEILNRNSSENAFIQFHIAALTAILGGVITLPEAGKWLIFIIPIESSLFGLWWLSNSLAIFDSGKYLSLHIEPRLNKLLKTKDVVSWETIIHSEKNRQKREVPVYLLLFSTFALPSIIAIILSILSVLLSAWHEFNLPQLFNYEVPESFYTKRYLLIACLCLGVDIFFFFQFWSKLTYWTEPKKKS